jgi:nitroreductase
MDKYQRRYLKHQQKKKKILIEIMKARHSTRIFGDDPIPDDDIQAILDVIQLTPTSCDRRPISTKVITNRDDKALLGGLLVGGVGWVHRAPTVILLFTDGDAYKENMPSMPYLDIGIVVQQIYLVCQAMGLKCCYINPNIRAKSMYHFRDYFEVDDNLIFGGAFAIGQEA